MTYFFKALDAMNHLFSRVASARSLLAWPAAAALAIGLTACASGPSATKALQNAAPVSHNCKPKETVGFSCEMQDKRLLSLCGSPDFLQFKGASKDNPGYAYTTIGTAQGEVQFTYPPKPQAYKNAMTYSVSLSGWPHMFVNTAKGSFLQFSLDIDEPVYVNPENAPLAWPVGATKWQSLCVAHINRHNLDPFMAQMIDDPQWKKTWGNKSNR
jgi:hypothetical protein